MRRIGALEAGGTKMVVAVGDENGKILDHQTIPTTEPVETVKAIGEYFQAQQVEAIGVACFGPIDVHKNSKTYGHILMTPKLKWRGFDILGELRKYCDVPMAFDTDVNGSAIGESRWGAAKDVNSCVYVTIGTGIGIGVITDGKPVHGALHPEGGHIMLKQKPGDTFGGVCPSHGSCFEGLAAGPAIAKHYGKPAIELVDCPEVWETESDYIAQALTTYICVLSPEKIILGGGVMKQKQLFPLIRKKVVEILNGYLSMPELDDIEHYVVEPGLGDDQGIMGCIAMVLNEGLI